MVGVRIVLRRRCVSRRPRVHTEEKRAHRRHDRRPHESPFTRFWWVPPPHTRDHKIFETLQITLASKAELMSSRSCDSNKIYDAPAAQSSMKPKVQAEPHRTAAGRAADLIDRAHQDRRGHAQHYATPVASTRAYMWPARSAGRPRRSPGTSATASASACMSWYTQLRTGLSGCTYAGRRNR